jgi:hypothetical protein
VTPPSLRVRVTPQFMQPTGPTCNNLTLLPGGNMFLGYVMLMLLSFCSNNLFVSKRGLAVICYLHANLLATKLTMHAAGMQ